MADNIPIDVGAGAKSVRTDDVGGQQVQIIKVAFGGDGVATDVDTGAGLPVNIENTVTVGTHAVTQSGTWTVQPGNTANTTAWKVDASSVAVPVTDNSGSLTVDGTVTANLGTIGGAATAAKQPALGTAGTASTDVITIQGIASGTVVPVSDGGGSLTVDGAVSFTAPQHVIVDSGTVTTVSTVTAVTDITNNVKVVGPTAADAALTVAPVTIGVRATNANPTNMSAAGDVVNAQGDLGGRLVTIDAPRELVHRTQTQLSNSTSETTIIAATSGVFHDLYGLIFANTGSTSTKVSIRDDTAGTVTAIFYVPTAETRGFMVPASSATPQTATNKNWTAQCANATTAMEITAFYVDRI